MLPKLRMPVWMIAPRAVRRVRPRISRSRAYKSEGNWTGYRGLRRRAWTGLET